MAVGGREAAGLGKGAQQGGQAVRAGGAHPAGFCVANSWKCGCARTASPSSGTNSSRLSSSSLVSRKNPKRP